MSSIDLKYPDPWKFLKVHYSLSYEEIKKSCGDYWKFIHTDKTKDTVEIAKVCGKIKVLIDCKEAFEKFKETFSAYNGNSEIAWQAVENLLRESRGAGKSNEDLLSLSFAAQNEAIIDCTESLKILYDFVEFMRPFSAQEYKQCQSNMSRVFRGFRKEPALFAAVQKDHADRIEKLNDAFESDKEIVRTGFQEEKQSLENIIANLQKRIISLTEINDMQTSSLQDFQNRVDHDNKKIDELLDTVKQLQAKPEDGKIEKSTEIRYLDFAIEQSTNTEDLSATNCQVINSSLMDASVQCFTPNQEIDVALMDVDAGTSERSILLGNIPKTDNNNNEPLNKPSSSSKEKFIFVCPVCKRTINHQNSVKRHMKTHEMEPLQCQVCRKPVARIDIYKRHLTMMHPNLTPTELETMHIQMLFLQKKKNSSATKK